MTYAKAKYAFGFCDRTGFRYPLKELVVEIKDGIPTGFRVGKDVVDPDHPQNFLGRVKINDPQSLLNPRPERYTESVTVKWPLFNERTLEPFGQKPIISEIGNVSITTS